MPTPDKFREVFEAWHRAVDDHVAMMRSVTEGAPLDGPAMSAKVAEIDELHATWTDLVLRRDERDAATDRRPTA
jgi:hypothetical protein